MVSEVEKPNAMFTSAARVRRGGGAGVTRLSAALSDNALSWHRARGGAGRRAGAARGRKAGVAARARAPRASESLPRAGGREPRLLNHSAAAARARGGEGARGRTGQQEARAEHDRRRQAVADDAGDELAAGARRERGEG